MAKTNRWHGRAWLRAAWLVAAMLSAGSALGSPVKVVRTISSQDGLLPTDLPFAKFKEILTNREVAYSPAAGRPTSSLCDADTQRIYYACISNDELDLCNPPNPPINAQMPDRSQTNRFVALGYIPCDPAKRGESERVSFTLPAGSTLADDEMRIGAKVEQFLRRREGISSKIWKPVVFSTIAGVGLHLLIVGGRALAIDGRCVGTSAEPEPNVPCPQVFDTQPLGLGLTIVGSSMLVGGVSLAVVLGRSRRQSTR